ncbi:ATP-binding protein (plasmid) [Cupriavidus sp. KK10]|uniref:AAA family ATPase n=1 Tax=Cupriavidus sp. KK10 TaxID=1478019 RepID=UPI001BA77AC8|nr:AAA family ATPase [Cupriavidus sp. KK10]QUN31704.1 ATP-binding protein [Cupriavidus sp. KK10]
MDNPNFYVITGASGAGKSTLLAALGDLGYSAVPEAARAVVREQLECNGRILPSVDRAAFMQQSPSVMSQKLIALFGSRCTLH